MGEKESFEEAFIVEHEYDGEYGSVDIFINGENHACYSCESESDAVQVEEDIQRLLHIGWQARSKVSEGTVNVPVELVDALKFYANQENIHETRYQDLEDREFQEESPSFILGKSGTFNEDGSLFYENGSIAQKALAMINAKE